MKTRIGHLLVVADLISDAQLARALEVQNFAGGRIGTLLLERAALGEDDLGKTLALQHGCAYAPWSILGEIAAEALAALPARFALKHCAVPHEQGEGYVKMALRDPGDLRILDELVFVTGCKVIAAAAPEVRIYQALEKYYGKLREPRYAMLAEKLSRPRLLAHPRPVAPPPPPEFFDRAPAEPSAGPARAPGPSPAPSGAQSLPDDGPLGWASFLSAAPEEEPFEDLLPNPGVGGFSEVLSATERDAIADAVLEALIHRFPRAAIFSSRSDGVSGWLAAGNGVSPAELRAFSVSWTEPSVFLKVRLSRSFYLGPLPPLPIHDRLAATLGGWPAECIVHPVSIGEKPVAFLYAAAARPTAIRADDLTYLRELSDAASSAFANAIRLKKKEI